MVSNLDDEKRIALFHRYENPELSQRLYDFIEDSPAIAEVRTTLGIAPGEERQFIPVVIRAGDIYDPHFPAACRAGRLRRVVRREPWFLLDVQ